LKKNQKYKIKEERKKIDSRLRGNDIKVDGNDRGRKWKNRKARMNPTLTFPLTPTLSPEGEREY
jgi:hypothetical protein